MYGLLSRHFTSCEGNPTAREADLHRGAIVVLKHNDKHPLRLDILIRTLAFHMVVSTCHSSLLAKWFMRHGKQRWGPPHPALIEAVALVPKNSPGQFDIGEFFSTVERIAKQKYATAV
jgi:hypothetical protein